MLAIALEVEAIERDPEVAAFIKSLDAEEPAKPADQSAPFVDLLRDIFSPPKNAGVVHMALDPTPIEYDAILSASVPTVSGHVELDTIIRDGLLGRQQEDELNEDMMQLACAAMAGSIYRIFTQAGYVRMKRFDTVPTEQAQAAPVPTPRQEPTPWAAQVPSHVTSEDLERIVIQVKEGGHEITLLTAIAGWKTLAEERGDKDVPSAQELIAMLTTAINTTLRIPNGGVETPEAPPASYSAPSAPLPTVNFTDIVTSSANNGARIVQGVPEQP